MGNLIRFEFHKLFRKFSFYMCGAVCIIMIFVILGTTKLAEKRLPVSTGENTAAIELCVTVLAGISIPMILAIFIALFVCEDNNFHTYKNVLAKGYSRTAAYGAKYIAAVCGALLLGLSSMVFTLLYGTALWNLGEDFDSRFIAILAVQLVLLIAYSSFYFFIAVLMKSSGASITIGIIVPLMIPTVLALIEYLLKVKKSGKLTGYWLDYLLANISELGVETTVLEKTLGVSLIYIVVCLCLGLVFCRKREV